MSSTRELMPFLVVALCGCERPAPPLELPRAATAAQSAAELESRIAALEATAAAQQAQLEAQQAAVDALTADQCPPGYTPSTQATEFTLCTRHQGFDQMVRVGDFWVDRYEASIWPNADCSGTPFGATHNVDDYPASFPDTGNVVPPATVPFACSRGQVRPAAMLTAFQAAQACAASGKHLLTGDEWQTAVAGTADPGGNDGSTNALCNTQSTAGSARLTAAGTGAPASAIACVSLWGAEDLIGNVWEMTADWLAAGNTWQDGVFADSAGTGNWPNGYGTDGVYNLNGRARQAAGFKDGLPAMGMRGGDFTSGTDAGAFALSLSESPASFGATVGFRCARHR